MQRIWESGCFIFLYFKSTLQFTAILLVVLFWLLWPWVYHPMGHPVAMISLFLLVFFLANYAVLFLQQVFLKNSSFGAVLKHPKIYCNVINIIILIVTTLCIQSKGSSSSADFLNSFFSIIPVQESTSTNALFYHR